MQSNILSGFIKLPKKNGEEQNIEKNTKSVKSPKLKPLMDNMNTIDMQSKCGMMFNKIAEEVEAFRIKAQCEEENNIVNLWESIKDFGSNAVAVLARGSLPNFYTMDGYILESDYSIDKVTVFDKNQTVYNKEYRKIFSNICKYINILQNYFPAYKFYAYCKYYETVKGDFFSKLKPYLASPEYMCYPMKSAEKNNYVPACCNHKILLLENLIIKIGNDYFDYNLSFFYKYCGINITIQEYELFNNFLKLYTRLLTGILNKFNIREITSNTPFSYYYKGNIHTLKAYDDTPLFKTVFESRDGFSPNLKPNDIGCGLPNALNGLKDYVPEKLLDCLGFLSSQDENVINRLSVLVANCLMAYPLSKKIFILKTNDDEAAKNLKGFVSNLISYNNRRCGMAENSNIEILDNYSINNFCSYETFKKLHSLRYANIKAVFIDRNNRKINSSEYSALINMATHTSSNQNSKQINNIQIILFQANSSISDLRSDDIITIDFSSMDLNGCFDDIPEMDFVWAKVYLALYGYRIIKKINEPKKGNIRTDLSSDARQEKIKEIIEAFLKECCVSPAEAKERRDARKNKTNALKRQNMSEDNIAKEVSDTPPYATYGDEFKKYINDYINLKYNGFGITADEIFKFFRNDEDYSKAYEYKDVRILYYDHKKGDGFRFLSIKKSWDMLYKELAQDYENIRVNDEKNVDIKELYQKIKTDIDFSELYAGTYLKIGGVPQ